MNSLAAVAAQNTALATQGADPFVSYGQQLAQPAGQFISFKNGEFLYGQESTELPLGTRLVANMPGFRRGWKCWKGGQLIEERMELLLDGKPHPTRASLGDLDQQLWDLDQNGKPRDPWQETNEVQLMDEQGNVYTYGTSSKGGRACLGKLCQAYGQEYRQRPGQAPIVTLGRDHYQHPTFGRTYVPVLEIVGWTDASALEAGSQEEPGATEPEDDGLPPFPGDDVKTMQATAQRNAIDAGAQNSYAAAKGRLAAQPAPKQRSGARF